MSQFEKIIFKILSGNMDNNIAFSDLVRILESLNFENRIKEAIIFIGKMALRKLSIFNLMEVKQNLIK